MAAPQEVEIKFLVSDLKHWKRSCASPAFADETPSTHEVNTLYDLPGQKLRRKGELLRLRKYRRQVEAHAQGQRPKREDTNRAASWRPSVADGERMDAILRALGFRPSFVYEKYRSEWSDGEGHVVLDHTPIGRPGGDRRQVAMDRSHRAQLGNQPRGLHHQIVC